MRRGNTMRTEKTMKGLSGRIALAMAVTSSFSIVVFAIVLWVQVDRQATRTGVLAGQLAAERLAPWLGEYYQRNGTWHGVERIMERGPRMMERPMRPAPMAPLLPAREALVLTDRNGTIILARGVEPTRGVEDNGPRPPWRPAGRRDFPGAGVPVTVHQETVAYLFMGGMVDRRDDPIRSALVQPLQLATMVSALVVLVVAALGVLWWSRHLTAPLVTLTQVVEEFPATAGHHHSPPTAPVPRHADELQTLTLAFNRMAREVFAQKQSRRRFISDAAHELRTPLALLSARIELLSDGTYPPDGEQWRLLQGGVDRLSRIVNDLQILARIDAGQAPAASGAVVVTDLLNCVRAAFLPAAEPRNITLVVVTRENEPPPVVHGDETMIRRIVDNLVSNSLNYSPDGTTIALSWEAPGAAPRDTVTICVDDQGPGIPESEREAVFQRFYRLESRRGVPDGGSGLGLAIARELARELHGTLSLQTPRDHGFSLRAVITLPASGTPAGDTPPTGGTPPAPVTPRDSLP